MVSEAKEIPDSETVQACAEKKVLFCSAPRRRNKAELSRNLATFLLLNPVETSPQEHENIVKVAV